MEMFWTALGSLITGAGLVWSVFKFYTEKRDKQHDEERQKFYSEFYKFQDHIEKDFEGTRLKLDSLSADVVALSTIVEVQKEKFSNMTEKFTEYAKEVRHNLERHSEEIGYLGKIIRVGNK